MKELWRKLRWHMGRGRFDLELDEEMRHHLALKAEEYGGIGGIEVARRKFGNVTLLKEDSRAMWTWTFWEQFGQDIRYALRAMKGNKVFTCMAAVSLALGIGANTAIYSFMDAIMLRALPVRHPEQLLILNWRAKGESSVVNGHSGSSYAEPGGSVTSPNFPYQAFEFLRDHNQSFSTLFGYADAGRLNLIVDGQAELGEGQFVSGGYFAALGVRPSLGRLISRGDDKPGAAPVVTISYSFWQRRFAGNTAVVGKSIVINGNPFAIAGVAAPKFFGVNPRSTPQVFIPVRQLALVDLNPYHAAGAGFSDGHFYWIEMMGRLKPGVSLTRAQGELAEQFREWVTGTARNEKDRKTLPTLWLQEGGSGVDSLRREYAKPLYILMTMVALILAIACANLANLLLARSAARRREMAVRLSLGAGRLRVVRQLLTESILLSLGGGLLGILVAALGIRSLTLLLANGRDNFTLGAELDWRVLLFTLIVALVTGVLFGLAPAIQATRVDVTPALKETRAGNPPGRRRRFGIPFGLSHALVVWQIATSLLIVAAAGLFVRTLANLHSVDVGFNRENILLFGVNGVQAGYKESALKNFYAELQRRFEAIPGVRNTTMTQMPLVANWISSTNVTIPGSPDISGKRSETSITQIGPKFFETMQIPILLGRPLDERDRENAQLTAVVNEVFAKRYFPGVSPLGRYFIFHEKEPMKLEIVGVAKTTRYSSLKDEIPPVVYLSYLQAGKGAPLQQMYFELRTGGEPLALAKTVRRIVHDVGPRVPIADMTTQARQIDETIVQERTFADLCTCFGVLAMTMACVGLYGTMAYAVARRTSEIGIRMALGAERRRIIWMVLREVLWMGGVGLGVGLWAILETTAVLKSFLFGLRPDDPVTLGGAALILIASALLAGYAPAWRASRIDPMVALRHE
jgi:macrolide transport system ATP-binding/permease protein